MFENFRKFSSRMFKRKIKNGSLVVSETVSSNLDKRESLKIELFHDSCFENKTTYKSYEEAFPQLKALSYREYDLLESNYGKFLAIVENIFNIIENNNTVNTISLYAMISDVYEDTLNVDITPASYENELQSFVFYGSDTEKELKEKIKDMLYCLYVFM